MEVVRLILLTQRRLERPTVQDKRATLFSGIRAIMVKSAYGCRPSILNNLPKDHMIYLFICWFIWPCSQLISVVSLWTHPASSSLSCSAAKSISKCKDILYFWMTTFFWQLSVVIYVTFHLFVSISTVSSWGLLHCDGCQPHLELQSQGTKIHSYI